MNIPANLLYAVSHEWVRMEGDEAVIGISDFAQEQLGDLTYVELPAVGDALTQGEELGSVESVKAASELYSPVTGEVIAINEALADAPETISTAPYTDGWLVRVRVAAAPEGLLDAAAYEEQIKNEH